MTGSYLNDSVSLTPSQTIEWHIAILAGGLATRLKPLTNTIPKSLMMIHNEPFIDYQLRLLKQQGFQHIVLCIGHLGALIEEYLGNGNQFDLNIQYSYEQDNLLGTAGALIKALPLLGEDFFVLYGDSYLPCNYHHVQQAFIKGRRLALMTVFANNNQGIPSNVEFEKGQILDYNKETPTSNMKYIDYGLGVFNRVAFSNFPLETAIDLVEVYQTQLKRNQLAGLEIFEPFYEIGSLRGIEVFKQYMERN